MANKPVRDIEIYLELQKSHVDKETGRIWVRGIASDNSVDFQNDIVEISKIGTSLSILNRGWGKFNFEHHDEKVGEITKVAFITPQEAFAKYGVECTGTVLELEGFIYAVTEKTPEKSDVRELHKLIDVGARLGFSLQGGIVQRIPVKGKDSKTYMVAVPSFVNLCAITTQPVNMNTICLPFAKSLAAVLCEGGLSEAEWSMVDEANHSANGVNKPAPLLFMGDGFGNGSVDALIKSAVGAALSSSGGQALVGALGGDSIRSGAVDAKATGTVVDEAATGSQCSRCNCAVTKATKFCPECGVMQPELRKSLQRATAGFSSSFENAFEHRLDLVSAARGFQEAFAL
ncbi:MAG TPA: hypothetical protein VGB77_15725 [Abditibacteriaceae bacterium]